ncbi:MAG TPA: DUF2752 domain-containing protein [Phycisphaerae bacterium]|nr:DUF2752 domain-containing protein [Phycisphaerae bacterium]
MALKTPSRLVLVGLALLAAAAALLYAVDPAGGRWFPPSPFRALTGFHCPGCGSLRALHRLMHGRVGEALGCNPLMVVILPFISYAALRSAVEQRFGRRLPGVRPNYLAIYALAALMVAYGVARNVPWAPLSHLAPAPEHAEAAGSRE